MDLSRRRLTHLFVILALTTPAFILSPMGIASSAPAAERAAVPSLSIGDVTVTEGNGGTSSAVFTITIASPAKATVTYTTVAGSATNPADFIPRSGTVRFAGHKLTRTVSVSVVGDVIDEPIETFLVELSKPKGATIADGTGVGTITDDDPPPTVAVDSSLDVPEGQSGDLAFASVDITLGVPSAKAVSVQYATANGTATEVDTDYVGDSGTAQFAPGETTKTVLVKVVGDDTAESDETFDVTLSAPVNASLGNATEVVTIVDNDPIPPGTAVLSISQTKVREGTSGTVMLTFTVTRSGDMTAAVSVDFASTNGVATVPIDYTTKSGTLAFTAAQTTGTIQVSVNGERALEHDERLFMNLLNPSAGAAISTGQAAGVIVNDDTKTTVGIKIKKGSNALTASGRVSPSRAGKRVVVKLFRKKNGAWVLQGGKRALLSGKTDVNADGYTDSRYRTKLARVKARRCKVVATFPGDSRFSTSHAVRPFRC